MSRTPLFNSLRQIVTRSFIATRDQAIESQGIDKSLNLVNRRQFLKLSGSSIGAWSLSPLIKISSVPLLKRATPRIAIIGAGIAGLSCAHQLSKFGLRSTIYEANTRVGGRMYTNRGSFADKQIAEFGGEFIDTGHIAIRSLAREFNIPLDNLRTGSEAQYSDEIFFINGRALSPDELVNSFKPLAIEMAKAVRRSDKDASYFAELDAMGIGEWIDSTGVADQDIRTLLSVAYTEEYGLEADEQSVFNLLYLIDYKKSDPFRVFGDSDEKFHLRGGNDRLPRKLAQRLHNQIETGTTLTAVRETSGGRFQLEFQRDSGSKTAVCDYVIFALPFTLLREVELAVTLPSWKQTVIQELGYGTNAKLIGGFGSKVWHLQNSSGSAISNNGIQTCWESSRKQAGNSGILTIFQGGTAGLALDTGTPEDQMQTYLPLLEQFFPGSQAAYSANSAIRFSWPTYEFTKGSYACYKRGQSRFYGLEGKSVGQLYFCGEHCSVNFQGYMEGGCRTGLRVADKILQKLGLIKTQVQDLAV